ncbi:MAG: hypothetical protein ABFD29_01830 [Anaerolineaceae bacterium]
MSVTWKFGSTDLTSIGAYSIITFEDANTLPSRRGDNPVIPQREGRLYVPKFYDQRLLSLGMYIKGANRSDFESKIDLFKALFGKGNQQILQRTMADGSVRQVGAEVSKFDISQKSDRYCKATVDFLLSSPFFRSTSKTSLTTTIDASPKTFTLTNPGTADDRTAVITLTGPLTNPKIINIFTNPVTGLQELVWVGYTGIIAALDTRTIDVGNLTCYSGANNYLNLLSHSGDAYFLLLKAGANTIRVESASTGGTVKIEFYAPYF